MAFLSDVQTHLNTFAAQNQVGEDEIHVRLTLADGSHVIVPGLQTKDAPTANGWGMIQSLPSPDSHVEALVIREIHVIKAEFQLAPSERKPIGFQSETAE